jgi:hypothetical protein
MNGSAQPAVCQFYRLIEGAPKPEPADRSAFGTLPVVAYSYCEPVAAASAWGWYIFPPLNFALVWDGREIAWAYEGSSGWDPVRAVPYPDFTATFARIAPDHVSDTPPVFLSQGKLPGTVQIWSGFLARTAPGWSLYSRGVVNLAQSDPYEDHETLQTEEQDADALALDDATPEYANFAGLIDTDTWFGPLFTNIRLMRTHSPVYFHMKKPLFQVQPVLRECYRSPSFSISEASDLTPEDWQRYELVARRNSDHMRRPGRYAADARRRIRREDAPT